MGFTNESFIEELMWSAFEQDRAVELAELAGSYILKERLSRYEAYEKAFYELGLKHKPDSNINHL